MSVVESIDPCKCAVTKLQKLPIEEKNTIFNQINQVDKHLASELALFFKHGYFGKFRYEEQYIAINDEANKLVALKRIMSQASYDKFERKVCL